MTDKPSCVALYKDKFNVQITEHEMYISEAGHGGVQAIVVRLDNNAPKNMQLASDTEKEIGAIGITGTEFDELLASQRLRYRIVQLAGGTDDGDVDLKGLAAAHSVIMGTKCH